MIVIANTLRPLLENRILLMCCFVGLDLPESTHINRQMYGIAKNNIGLNFKAVMKSPSSIDAMARCEPHPGHWVPVNISHQHLGHNSSGVYL